MFRILKIIYFLLFMLIILSGCRRDFSTTLMNSVYVRFYNNSPHQLDDVIIGAINFGSINPFSFSNYNEVKSANEYSDIRLKIDRKAYLWFPSDVPGEPFDFGTYLFLISVHKESGQINVAILDNDELPENNQPNASSQFINQYEYYYGTSLVRSGFDCINIAATNRIRSVYNPTIAVVPNSKLIYLPDAFIVSNTYKNVIIKTNNSGDILSIKSSGTKNIFGHRKKKILSDSNNNTFICGENSISDGTLNSNGYPNWRAKIWWQKFNENGDSLFLKINTEAEPFWFNDANLNNLNQYLITGRRGNNGYMLSLDENGNVLKEKIFYDVMTIFTSVESYNNTFLVSSYDYLKKLDSNFDEIWSVDFRYAKQIINLTENTFISLQNEGITKWNSVDGTELASYSYQNKYDQLLWMCKIDSSKFVIAATENYRHYWSFMINEAGEIQWEKKIDLPFYCNDCNEYMSNPIIKLDNSTLHLLVINFSTWLFELSNSSGEILLQKELIE